MGLNTFKNNLRKHMIKNGMFDVFLYEAADGTKYDLFKNHSRVTVAQLQQYWDDILADNARSDRFIRDNLKWSGEYIRKTVSQPILERLLNETKTTTIGPVTLVALLRVIYSDGYDAIELLKQDLKKIEWTQFPGEDVEACCVSMMDICDRLDAADAFQQEFLCTMTCIFELSSERRFQDWAMKKYRACQEQVKAARFQGVEAYRAGLADPSAFITYTSLCSEAKEEYRDLVASERYSGAKTTGKNDEAPALQATVQSAVHKALNSVLKASGLQPKDSPGSGGTGGGNGASSGSNGGNSNSSDAPLCDYCKKRHHGHCWKKR